jgi:hypothetical protein
MALKELALAVLSQFSIAMEETPWASETKTRRYTHTTWCCRKLAVAGDEYIVISFC